MADQDQQYTPDPDQQESGSLGGQATDENIGGNNAQEEDSDMGEVE